MGGVGGGSSSFYERDCYSTWKRVLYIVNFVKRKREGS
jgi:hypothetical protein